MKLSPEGTGDQCWFTTHVYGKSCSRFLQKHHGQDGRDKYFTFAFIWDAGYPILCIRRNDKLSVNATISHEELARYDASDLSIQTVILENPSDFSFVNGLTTTFKVKFDTSMSASSFLECYNELSVQKLNKSKEQNDVETRLKKKIVSPTLAPVRCNDPIKSTSDSSKTCPSQDKEYPVKACVKEILETLRLVQDQGTLLTLNDRLTHLLLTTVVPMRGVSDLNDAVKELKQDISTFCSTQNQDTKTHGNCEVVLKVDVDDNVESEDNKEDKSNDDGEDKDKDKIFSDTALPNDHFFVDSQNSQDFRTRFEYK